MKKLNIILLVLITALLFANFSPVFAEEKPNLNASNALLIHLDTNAQVYEKAADERVYPAGAPKIMTAILTLEKTTNLDEKVTAKASAFKGISAISSANIKAGEILSVKDLLYCLMVASSNEAANILAEYVSGDVNTFVELMNKRAKELGANNTYFTNTHGIYDSAEYSTARDIAIIAKHAINLNGFFDFVDTATYTIPKTNLKGARLIYSNNQVLQITSSYYISYAKGIKATATTEGGYSLISLAEKKIGKKTEQMLCVVLGCTKTADGATLGNAFKDTKSLYNWVYSTYKVIRLIKQDDPVTEAKVQLASGKDFVLLVSDSTVDALMPGDYTADKLEKVTTIPDKIFAPVEKGQQIGEMVLKYNNVEYGRVKLISQNEIQRNAMLYYSYQLNQFFSNIWVRIASILIAAVFILYVVYTIIYNNKRKHYRPVKRRIKF